MKKTAFTFYCCLIGMLGSGAATSDPFDYNPGFIRFPFARSGSDFTNTCKGYGDNNMGFGLKLFHAGVDFQAEDTTEYVRTPFDPAYVIRADSDSLQLDWRVIFGLSANAETGWGYHHLYRPQGFAVTDSFTGLVSPVVVTPDLGPHVHIDWCINLNSIYVEGNLIVYDSYINPLDYFLNKPSNYDHPELGEVSGSSTGLRIQNTQGFLPDTAVFGQVHFVARPVSAPDYGSTSDSVGVRYLRHRVLRQDPYTGEYAPLPWYDWRTLFSMNGFIPFQGDEFFDFVYATTSGHYHSEYLLNNCGTTPVGLNADSAFNNVWTAGYDRAQDWADGVFCRGAFDTRLGTSTYNQQSCDNSNALIPDGRYCVEMEAYSHGNSQAQTWRLPVLDVAAENLSPGDSSNVRGFIVDNFAPHVASLLVYLPVEPGSPDTIYNAEWILSPSMDQRHLAGGDLAMYLSESQEQWVGVAVLFSETMASLPDIWISGEWGGQIRWTSANLTATEWDYDNLGEPPSAPPGHSWQSYRTDSGITTYHGALRLNIQGGADLSGNSIDANPATIAVRDANGNFSGYEQGTDNGYIWGTTIPIWSKNSSDLTKVESYNTRYGFLEATISYFFGQYKILAGAIPITQYSSCPYWHGFWMMRNQSSQPPSMTSPRVCIIDFNGTVVRTFLLGNAHTLYPVSIDSENSSHIDVHLQTGSVEDGTFGDYLWVSITNYEPSMVFWGAYYVTFLKCFTAQGLTSHHHISKGFAYFRDSNEIVFYDSLRSVSTNGSSCIYDWIEQNPNEPYNIHGSYNGSYFNFSPPGIGTGDTDPVRSSRQDSGIADASEVPSVAFGLSINRNPVSSELMLRISLERSGPVEVFIYDIAGRTVLKALEEDLSAGVHSLTVPVHLPGGIYFCRLRSGSDIASEKLVILR